MQASSILSRMAESMATRPLFELTTGEWKFTYDLKQTAPGALNGTLKLQSVNDSRNAKVSLTRSQGN